MECGKPLNADIEFCSTQHVLDEIEGMNVKGGSPFGRAAAWAFKLAVLQEELNSPAALMERVEEISCKLTELKPTMGTIANTIHFVKLCCKKHEGEPVERVKAEIVKLCERIIDSSFKAVRKLGEYGGALIHDGDVVMMHSYSSSLMSCFEHAAKSGTKFSMICTESRPLRESRLAVKMLQSFGVPVTYITDASIWEFMPKADLVIMGVDALAFNGDVANKMGAALVTQLAQLCKVPVYVASEIYKLDYRTRFGYRIRLERRCKEEMILPNDFESLEGIDVYNQFFDLTPAAQVAGVITQYGIINPASVHCWWEQFERELLGD
ncbi:MAG: translation initiation factor eIF-2B [Clostridia bacterium]|nr:translation initiation factor eIF-2B [Clostridia bacterium]